MSNIKKGFTLIELLVVIAIIGILATVVLASLGTARARANDAKIQAQVSGSRAQAEIFAGGNGNSYVGVCGTGVNSFTTFRVTGDACADDVGAWAYAAPISGTRWFCADSTGTTREIPGAAAPITDGSDYSCS